MPLQCLSAVPKFGNKQLRAACKEQGRMPMSLDTGPALPRPSGPSGEQGAPLASLLARPATAGAGIEGSVRGRFSC